MRLLLVISDITISYRHYYITICWTFIARARWRPLTISLPAIQCNAHAARQARECDALSKKRPPPDDEADDVRSAGRRRYASARRGDDAAGRAYGRQGSRCLFLMPAFAARLCEPATGAGERPSRAHYRQYFFLDCAATLLMMAASPEDD